jgi:hypothetical protein
VASSNANSNRAIQHYNDGLSTSRSAVDFRHVATTSTRQSIASGQNSSRSNEDSLAIDLSNVAEAAEDLLNQTLASVSQIHNIFNGKC